MKKQKQKKYSLNIGRRIVFPALMICFILSVGVFPVPADEQGLVGYPVSQNSEIENLQDTFSKGLEPDYQVLADNFIIRTDVRDAIQGYELAQVLDPRSEEFLDDLPNDLPDGPELFEEPMDFRSPVLSQKIDAQEFSEVDGDVMIDKLQLKNIDINDVLNMLSQKAGLNIIAGKGISGKVTIFLQDVKLKDALRIILDSNQLAYEVDDGIIRVMTAKEFELRNGYIFGGEMKTQISHLLYAKASDLMAVLTQVKSPNGKIISDEKSNLLILMDTEENLKLLEEIIGQVDVPVQTEVFPLSYSIATEIAEKVAELLTDNLGRLQVDERSNQLIVTDSRLKILEIGKMIEAFDRKERQVLIEAKIVQIVLSDQFKFGVDWERIVEDHHDLTFKSDFGILSSGSKKGRVSIGTLAEDSYTALLEALETVGTTNILSNPSISSLNNQEARILVGSTEPYVTSTTTTPSSGPTTTAETVNFIDVGVKLYVTPTIHPDDFITMKIKPEISSVTSTLTTSNNNTIPIVDTSEAETTVMVKDGITIVIGGLIKEEKIRSENKVPLLGDVPLVGGLFRNSDDLTKKTEIVIFLTPKIITGDVPSSRTIEEIAPEL